MTTRRLIALLTDFGLEDNYVGQVKGVLTLLAPEMPMIDITHGVRPGAVEQGAFLLETALPALHSRIVVLAVVDPGVGTERTAVALQHENRYFVGPDNGLLSAALPDDARPTEPGMVPLPPGVTAVTLKGEPGAAISATFHGRDLFAVAAARLARGTRLASLGEPVEHLYALPPFRGRAGPPGIVTGRVVHIDRFGNVLTSIRAADLPGPLRSLDVAGTRIDRVVRTYGEGSGLVALTGSSGYIEAAEVNGSAAARLEVDIGEEVRAACA